MSDLNIQRFGSGEQKLVAVHGLGSASSAWELVKPEFQKYFELITLDLPGHGNSNFPSNKEMTPNYLAQLIKTELASADIHQFHLIGNSLGGWISLELAVLYPENVLSVTALAPAGLWLVPKDHRDGELALSRYLARATYRFAGPISKIKYLRSIGFSLVSPQWEKLSPKTCADAAIAMGSASGYYDLWDSFLGSRFDKEIDSSIPVTIIFGDTDNTLPAKNSQEKSLAPAHSEWIILPQSGHAPMWDSVDSVIAETLRTTNKVK